LRSRFDQIGDIGIPWDFFLVNHDFVPRIAVLASPDLLLTLHGQCAKLAEYARACLTELRVSRSHLSLVLEAVELDFEHVGVELLLVGLGLCCYFRSPTATCSPLLRSHCLEDCSSFLAAVTIRVTETACHVVGVNFLAGQIGLLLCLLDDLRLLLRGLG